MDTPLPPTTIRDYLYWYDPFQYASWSRYAALLPTLHSAWMFPLGLTLDGTWEPVS